MICGCVSVIGLLKGMILIGDVVFDGDIESAVERRRAFLSRSGGRGGIEGLKEKGER